MVHKLLKCSVTPLALKEVLGLLQAEELGKSERDMFFNSEEMHHCFIRIGKTTCTVQLVNIRICSSMFKQYMYIFIVNYPANVMQA